VPIFARSLRLSVTDDIQNFHQRAIPSRYRPVHAEIGHSLELYFVLVSKKMFIKEHFGFGNKYALIRSILTVFDRE
jgi:hypothetical protein